ncbi:hypothetical protein CYY_005825 [Polysphondylium violaceum]|uniref:Uncharacterized protein n=1 Tax=Polysphondylium violaceum TaxID=133409 RepID=A0A8J4PS92_9MYCE|nr:hypothetical protein CYY_005825 [Polysphondylium violaceum]
MKNSNSYQEIQNGDKDTNVLRSGQYKLNSNEIEEIEVIDIDSGNSSSSSSSSSSRDNNSHTANKESTDKVKGEEMYKTISNRVTEFANGIIGNNSTKEGNEYTPLNKSTDGMDTPLSSSKDTSPTIKSYSLSSLPSNAFLKNQNQKPHPVPISAHSISKLETHHYDLSRSGKEPNQLIFMETPELVSNNNVGDLFMDNEKLIYDGHKKKLSLFQLICLSISFLGIQFGWALQIAFSTPLFLELGVSQFWVSFIWLAGPISGLLVQPIVGVISDKSECKYGRRKPFIFGGSLFICVGLVLISNAASIGTWFGDSDLEKPISIIISIIGFWILDLSNNSVQGPCRALLVDVAAPSQQGIGSSLFSLMLGLGNLLGYLMGSIQLIKIVPFMKTDTRALFTLSVIILLICVSITLIVISEEKYTRISDQPVENPIKTLFKGITNIPPYLRRLCAVQFFSWIGWFAYILFITTWVGVNIYGGDPNAVEGSDAKILFQQGVRAGSLGLTFSSAVTIAVSLTIPFIIKLIGTKYTYLIGNIIQTICFAMFYFVHSKLGAIILIACTGIPWAIVMILPFSIVGMGVSEHESGFHIGALNIFVVIPQLIVSLSISFVISFFHGDVVSSLITGSIASFIATLLVFRLIIPDQQVEEIGPESMKSNDESKVEIYSSPINK